MDKEAIEQGVNNAAIQCGLKLTSGAVNAVVQMILNIEEDPSSSWQQIESGAVQQQIVNMLPDILRDFIDHPGRISSWEIWHNASRLLDSSCPIPKDI